MSLLCIAAARLRIIPFWLAVTVAVLGGLGPFAGSIGFVIADRRRRRQTRDPASTARATVDSMAVDTSTVQVVMPAMGDSVAEGTVLEWHKQEGDSVAADETIVEISTDKVDAEVPAPVAGHDRQASTPPRATPSRSARCWPRSPPTRPAAATAPAPDRPPPRSRPPVVRRSRRGGRSRRRRPRAGARHRGGRTAPRPPSEAAGRDDRHRHAHRRRVGDRGHDPRVVGQGRRRGQGRRHRRRDLDRQGRHGASRARPPGRSPRSSPRRARPSPSGR